MKNFKRAALLVAFCLAAFLILTNAKAQTTQSGNPNPGPVGIDSSSVMVCDPYNPMNCESFTAHTAPNSSASAAQTLANANALGAAQAIAGPVTTFPGPQLNYPAAVPQLSRWRAACRCFTNAP